MAHECEECGSEFSTLSRLRLHDCSDTSSQRGHGSGFSGDDFSDGLSEAMAERREERAAERDRRGRRAASDDFESALEAARAAEPGETEPAFTALAAYEQDLRRGYDRSSETFRALLWTFYEPVAEILDETARREGWSFLAEIVATYPRETEPHCSVAIENAVSRHVVRTRLRDGVASIPTDALDYLGSFWQSMGNLGGEESAPYGWGIGHPDHAVASHLREVVTEEPFWVRGCLHHAFYADQDAAADLFETLVAVEDVDYEDRYFVASVLSALDRSSDPTVPRYWSRRQEISDEFEFTASVRDRLRTAVEDNGFDRRLPSDWTFHDMEV
ncbi:MAG: hypothetical protein ABEH80_09360 [Halobaculum sp.]